MSSFQNVDPASGEVLAEIPIASLDEVRAATRAAREAQVGWAEQPLASRLDRLAGGMHGLQQRADELAQLVTQEMGKTLRSARAEVQGQVAEWPQLAKEFALAFEAEIYPAEKNDTTLVREPHGVVAAIAPWNFPVGMPISILLPALAAGNGVVFKPSELVPQSGALLAEILNASLPADLLQVVQGDGAVGAALVASDVDMVGFVGSRDTGARIMASAAADLKRLVLELGGKDPMLVFADADLEAAADCAVQHSLRNTGQVCCSIERIYVAEAVADTFEQLVLERAGTWNFGSGLDDEARMGPMVSAEQRRKVDEQVRDAVDGGARLLLGGAIPQGQGYFYPATVVADVRQDQRMTREETFGPVVSLTRFSGDEEEGIRLANDTPYGLGANVWTADRDRAQRVAAGLRAGQVGVNRYLGGAPGTPWVGARQSGFGFLGGVEGHRQFTTPKTICTAN